MPHVVFLACMFKAHEDMLVCQVRAVLENDTMFVLSLSSPTTTQINCFDVLKDWIPIIHIHLRKKDPLLRLYYTIRAYFVTCRTHIFADTTCTRKQSSLSQMEVGIWNNSLVWHNI